MGGIEIGEVGNAVGIAVGVQGRGDFLAREFPAVMHVLDVVFGGTALQAVLVVAVDIDVHLQRRDLDRLMVGLVVPKQRGGQFLGIAAEVAVDGFKIEGGGIVIGGEAQVNRLHHGVRVNEGEHVAVGVRLGILHPEAERARLRLRIDHDLGAGLGDRGGNGGLVVFEHQRRIAKEKFRGGDRQFDDHRDVAVGIDALDGLFGELRDAVAVGILCHHPDQAAGFAGMVLHILLGVIAVQDIGVVAVDIEIEHGPHAADRVADVGFGHRPGGAIGIEPDGDRPVGQFRTLPDGLEPERHRVDRRRETQLGGGVGVGRQEVAIGVALAAGLVAVPFGRPETERPVLEIVGQQIGPVDRGQHGGRIGGRVFQADGGHRGIHGAGNAEGDFGHVMAGGIVLGLLGGFRGGVSGLGRLQVEAIREVGDPVPVRIVIATGQRHNLAGIACRARTILNGILHRVLFQPAGVVAVDVDIGFKRGDLDRLGIDLPIPKERGNEGLRLGLGKIAADRLQIEGDRILGGGESQVCRVQILIGIDQHQGIVLGIGTRLSPEAERPGVWAEIDGVAIGVDNRFDRPVRVLRLVVDEPDGRAGEQRHRHRQLETDHGVGGRGASLGLVGKQRDAIGIDGAGVDVDIFAGLAGLVLQRLLVVGPHQTIGIVAVDVEIQPSDHGAHRVIDDGGRDRTGAIRIDGDLDAAFFLGVQAHPFQQEADAAVEPVKNQRTHLRHGIGARFDIIAAEGGFGAAGITRNPPHILPPQGIRIRKREVAIIGGIAIAPQAEATVINVDGAIGQMPFAVGILRDQSGI